jgi:hypothetical protein
LSDAILKAKRKKKDLLVCAVGGRVSGLDTDLFKVENPLKTGRSRCSGGTTESDTLLSDGQVVIHPVTERVLGRYVGLSSLVGLVEEQGVLDGSRPLVLVRVPISELMRTPDHGNVFETKSVTRALMISAHSVSERTQRRTTE